MPRVLPLFATGLLFAGAALAAEEKAAKPPPDIGSASQLVADAERDSWTYSNPAAQFGRYKRFLIEDTVVHNDPQAKWAKTTPETRQKFAGYLTSALRREMQKHYQLATAPGPDVAILRLTLLGVKGTTGGVATVSRLTPIGLATNSVKSLAGKRGSFSGSVLLAFEMLDAQSRELQFAAVRRRSPDALDIGSTTSTESTVKAVAGDVAEAIRKGIDKAAGRPS